MNSSGVSTSGKNSIPSQIRLVISHVDNPFETFIEKLEKVVISLIASEPAADAFIVAQIVKLQDTRRMTNIVLPLRTVPALLPRSGRSWTANVNLGSQIVAPFVDDLDRITQYLDKVEVRKYNIDGGVVSPSGHDSKTEFPLYIPDSELHTRILVSPNQPLDEAVVFEYSKDGCPLWSIHMGLTNNTISLMLNSGTLGSQYTRMKAGQTHGLTLLIRDFIKNAIDMALHLGKSGTAGKTLFFPGVFDIAGDVQKHYDAKVARFTSQEESKAGRIRKYNNLMKSCIINHFVPQDPVVLDVACGHGQDLMKYKASNPILYIGTDISQAALTEARRRYRSSKLRYPADFVYGNLMVPDTFDRIHEVAANQGLLGEALFDVVSMQLALHYVIGSFDEAQDFLSRIIRMLKPGGRFIATFPCCERIAQRLRCASVQSSEDRSNLSFGNEFYRVNLEVSEFAKLVPDLDACTYWDTGRLSDKLFSEVDFDEVSIRASETWGVKYNFWLVDTIENQEEYIVPISALTRLVKELGLQVEFSGDFGDVFKYMAELGSSTISEFRGKNPRVDLNDMEEEVFNIYRAIVFSKTA